MLDIKLIRENTQEIIRRLETRGGDFQFINDIVDLDEQRRSILSDVESKKNFRNDASKQIGVLKREGKDTTDLMSQVSLINDQIKELDIKVNEIELKLSQLLNVIPNVPRETLKVGTSEEDNVEVRVWGEKTVFPFEAKPHWDLGTKLNILDFERGAKITGARFTVYKGLGARLERALINFMLDLHTSEHGYTETLPPFMVNKASATGTGQLPKFAEDMFKLEGLDYYLIPTAEVPVSNLYRDEILDMEDLPIYHVAYSACFRSEAGAAGRDTRGLIRVHQ